MCSLCFKGKNGVVDFIKADVLTCLCGSFKDKQQEAHSCLGVTPWMKADYALNKGEPHVCDDSPWSWHSFHHTKRRFHFFISKFHLFQHYQLWEPVCHHPITIVLLTFYSIVFKQLNIQIFPSLHGLFENVASAKENVLHQRVFLTC